MNTNEVWKEVVGFPQYECSTLGRFRHKTRKRVLKQSAVHNGYLHVGLMRDGKQVTKLNHRLIAEMFLEQPSDKHDVVDHKNHIRTDNTVANLEWVTRSQNMRNTRKNAPKCKCCGRALY